MIGAVGMNMHPRAHQADDSHQGQKRSEDSELLVHDVLPQEHNLDIIALDSKSVNGEDVLSCLFQQHHLPGFADVPGDQPIDVYPGCNRLVVIVSAVPCSSPRDRTP